MVSRAASAGRATLIALATALAGCSFLGGGGSYSDVVIENVALAMPPSGGQTATISLDIGWSYSFRDELNWDAAWVFVKFRESGGAWRHASLSSSAADHAIGANYGVLGRIVPAADGRGVFMHRAQDGFGAIGWEDVTLAWDAGADGVDPSSSVEVEVIALQMVYIPEGPFMLGDGLSVQGQVSAQFESGRDNRPFEMTSEESLTLGGSAGSNLGNHDRQVSSATAQQFWDDFGATTTRSLPAEFPKGFAAFYVMKHEITQGEYARFLNTLDRSQQESRNPAINIRPSERHRYAISESAPFRVAPHNRAANYLSWMDIATFADWSGLRPMTELEFEKAARGDRAPEPGEFAWGPEAPPAAKYTLEDADTPDETIANQQAGGVNVAFGGTVGIASSISGPLRTGAFFPRANSRLEFGGSYYRVMEMSGNVAEIVISVGRSAGRRFRGVPGDGELSWDGNAAGSEVEFWPGARRAAEGGYEVRGADGTGLRGGDWSSEIRRLHVSDREEINKPADRRDMRWGGRLVRSAR